MDGVPKVRMCRNTSLPVIYSEQPRVVVRRDDERALLSFHLVYAMADMEEVSMVSSTASDPADSSGDDHACGALRVRC